MKIDKLRNDLEFVLSCNLRFKGFFWFSHIDEYFIFRVVIVSKRRVKKTFLVCNNCPIVWLSRKATTPLSGTVCSFLHSGQRKYFLSLVSFSRHLRQNVCVHDKSFGCRYSSRQTGQRVVSAA